MLRLLALELQKLVLEVDVLPLLMNRNLQLLRGDLTRYFSKILVSFGDIPVLDFGKVILF